MSHRSSVRLLVVALGVAALVAANSHAAGKKTKTASPFAAHIKTLHQIHATLAQADHDYKGHRVAAMKHVHAAVAALRVGTTTGKKTGKKATKTVKTGGGLPQEQSDALLKQALGQIKTLYSDLTSLSDDRATAAAASLKTAAKELNTALSIK